MWVFIMIEKSELGKCCLPNLKCIILKGKLYRRTFKRKFLKDPYVLEFTGLPELWS